jgi:hypothetical protein
MQPKTALGTPFSVEILLCEYRLYVRPMTLQSTQLIWYKDVSRTAGG